MQKNRQILFGTTILAGLVAMSAPAWAQSTQTQTTTGQTPPASQEQATEVEEIIVTGSRIRRPETDGTIPGVQITSQAISERLFTNAGDILNDVPLVGAGASLSGTNGGQPSSLGVTYIDLLNLGTARTLTLVNGRRFVSNNSATIFVAGNETGSQVDASTIPTALIDRVDILTVGGAAAYGSDAVSGVVNYILKDRYEGAEINLIGGQTFEYQDAGRIAINGAWGRNFLDDRLNIAIGGEYTKIDGVLGIDRPLWNEGQGYLANPLNGATRNPAFVPGGTAPVFISAAADNILGSVRVNRVRNNNTWIGGVIFNPVQSNGSLENPTIANLPTNSAIPVGAAFFQPGNTFRNPGFAQISPFQWSFSSNLAMVPSTPFGACIPSATDVCQFAPASLTAAEVAAARTRYGLPATYTTAQVLAVVQANRPTAREYYRANPNTPINAFLGTFLPLLPDVPTTGALASVLPRTAVPLRFNSNGDIETFNLAGDLASDPNAPGSLFSNSNGDGMNPNVNAVLRVQQERRVGNLFANYDVTDNIRFFNETLYSKIDVVNPTNTGALANTASVSTPENAGVLVNVNHPFLTAANRATLAAAGITGNFILARNNWDIIPDLNQVSTNETFRTVNGFNGGFSLGARNFNWELSHTYGKAETEVRSKTIDDLRYAMAIDAASTTQCRAQTAGLAGYLASYGGSNASGWVPGAIPQVISRIGADGVREQVVFSPVPTQADVDACRPLNIFGQGRASQEAIDFVTVDNVYSNESTQNFVQGILSGDIVQLPGGLLQFAVSGEFRKEELVFGSSVSNAAGRTRFAPSAYTNAYVETTEGGVELRIPIFGEGFTLPFVQALEFSPAIRWSKMKGEGERFRNVSGVLQEPSYDGDVEEIYTLAGTWRVNDSLMIRGNYSKSIRNPSIVELFLGNQPFFTSSADPCSSANFLNPNAPAPRQANCIAEVRRIAAQNGGVLLGGTGTPFTITSDADARNYITQTGGYSPSGASFTGLISGRQTLRPEKGDSFTFGFVGTPSFIPNLLVSADYLEITVTDVLGPLLAQSAAVFCYDSPQYPDNSAELGGTNSCAGIVRDQAFNFANGFELPFWNQGAVRVKAINANMAYSLNLSDVFTNATNDLGTIGVRANAYYLLEYTNSANGTFADGRASENSLGNPTWKSQVTFLYDLGRFSARWTTNFQDASIVRAAGTNNQVTPDQGQIQRWPAYTTHTLGLGYRVTDNATARFVVDNVFDADELSDDGRYNGTFIDNIGRRWSASLSYRF